MKVVAKLRPKWNKKSQWLCVCICGNFTVVCTYDLRTGNSKTCGCGRWNYIRPYENIFNKMQRTAQRNKHTFHLSFKAFLEFVKITRCHYCNAFIQWFARSKKNSTRVLTYNLDRKDNTKGYTKSNLVVCCKRCNYTKGDRFTYEEFVQIGNTIRTFKGECK